MVVNSRPVSVPQLDLGYLGLFLGLRVNELVTTRMARAGFSRVRESHGYVIQHLVESERSITELAERMEVTQQAASKVVAELTRLGILEVAHTQDRRSKRIRLSRRGWQAVQMARRIRRQIESGLIRKIGEESYAAGKSILSTCLEALGGIERIHSRRIRQPC
jgi:DNA-binding MarR family transcriptional regulator